MVEYNSRAYIPYSNTTDIYNISFTYRHREEIFINIKDSDGITTEYLVGMDWKFLNDSQVKLISKPSVGAIIEIYRLTNNTSREAKFAASDVSIGELDDSADQTFKIVQEAVDIANLSREESITTAIAAEQALINSEQALENSEEAVDAAGSAAESASTARNAAINAAEDAAQAVHTANDADSKADQAIADSAAAVTTAGTAASNASNALSTANGIDAKATQALTDSATSLSIAQSAASDASTALSTANDADSKSNQAITDSATAVHTTAQYATQIANAETSAAEASEAAQLAATTAAEAMDAVENSGHSHLNKDALDAISYNSTTGSFAVGGVEFATASDLAAHTSNANNPHAVTATQVGLGNVDNTSDLSKPISTAMQAALTEMHAVIDAALAGINTAKTLSMAQEVEINLAEANIFKLELTGDCKFINPDNPKPGKFTVFLTQNSTGEHTVEWDGRYTWPNGVAPTLSTDPYKTDVIVFESSDGLSFRGFASTGYDLPAVPRLSLSNYSLSTSAVVGYANPASQTFDVLNIGEHTLNFSISDNAGWLSVSPTSGSTASNRTITVSYNTTALALGEYSATITVSSNNGDNSPQTLEVKLHITEVPDATINTNVSALTQESKEGENAASQSFTITNSGAYGSTLNYSISDNAGWLSVSPTSGSLASGESQTVTVNYNTANIVEGTHNANITVSASDCTNSPQVIPVTLEIRGLFSEITVGSVFALNDVNNNNYSTMIKMSPDKVLVCYGNNGSSGTGKINLLSISGSTLTLEDEVNFGDGGVAYISIAKITDSTAIICYMNQSAAPYGRALIVGVSGTTLTAYSEVGFSDTLPFRSSVIVDSTNTKAVVCYRDSSNSSYGTAQVLTINDTVISDVGTKVVFNEYNTQETSLTLLPNGSIFVAYSNTTGRARLLSISGSTLTLGSEVVIASTAISKISSTLMADNAVLVCYGNSSAYARGRAQVLTISGSTISTGTEYQTNGNQYVECTSVEKISERQALLCYEDMSANYYGAAQILTVSGSAIAVGDETVFNTSRSDYMTVAHMNEDLAVVSYIDRDNSYQAIARLLTLS